jgi:hypothetical protein
MDLGGTRGIRRLEEVSNHPTYFGRRLEEPSISKALAKATKAAESSQESPPTCESMIKPPEVMKIHSDWCTPFMIYFRTWGLPEDKVDYQQLHH